MSNDATEQMGTKPLPQHEWLNHFVGEWDVESEMMMGHDQPWEANTGSESCKSLGGLWAFAEGVWNMAGTDSPPTYYFALGYDVSFHEYRGCFIASMSSHLWKYTGDLSADGKTMTLTCEGPHMMKDGATTLYRDVHQIVGPDERTMVSMSQDDDGNWIEFMKSTYRRRK